MTGSLLQSTCEAFRLESGLVGKIINFPECVYSYITPTWVSQMWEACRPHKIQVIGANMDLNLPRQADVELMRLFIHSGFRNTELTILNKCRMFLQVIFLSDICKASGTKLESHMWQHPVRHESPYKWPTITPPTLVEWRMWQQALQKATLTGQNLTLPLPLGRWQPHQGKRLGWYYNEQENALYHRTQQGVTRHSTYPRRSRAQTFHRQGELTTDLLDWVMAQIATVRVQGEKITLTGVGWTQET